ALYPYAATALTTIAANAGPTGLVESCFGGTDYSEQTNRPRFEDPRDNRTLSSRLSGVEDIGLLFHACQQGAELAGALNDEKLLKTCLNLSRRIEAGFMGHFFDAEEGFFIDCVWPKDKPVNRNRTFRLTSLLALSGHGELLSLDEWDRLADFIVRRLGHPVIGLRECPADQPMHPTGRNRSENWFQNASRETFRLARLSGNQELLRILLEKAEFFFGAERVLRENLYNNQATQFFDASRLYVSTSWWQCMTTASWWLGLLEALAGIRLTQGNLEYLPGDGGSDVRLTNLFYGGRVWEVDVRGRGRFVAGLEINGRPFDGTQQLEAADERPEQRVRIEKTNRPPVHPVVLGAGAARARITRLEPGRLEAGLAAPGYCRLWFYSPEQPRLLVDGRPIRFAWSPKRHEGTAGFRAGGDSRLEIRCPAAGRRP
ncbi:MAG TPA: hypothetical protein PKN80_08470, partial [bacterium]|nr:hypothetical protein [bacterium]